MLRSNLARVLAILLVFTCVGLVLAVEGTIVTIDKTTVEVKIGDKTEKVDRKGLKLSDKEGKAVKGKDAGDVFKAGTKVEVTKEGDKVVEIKIK